MIKNTNRNRVRLLQVGTGFNIAYWTAVFFQSMPLAWVLLAMNCISLALYFWVRRQPDGTNWDAEVEADKLKTANPIKDN